MVGTRVGVGSAFGLQPMSKLKTSHAIINPEGSTSICFEILKSCSFQIIFFKDLAIILHRLFSATYRGRSGVFRLGG